MSIWEETVKKTIGFSSKFWSAPQEFLDFADSVFLDGDSQLTQSLQAGSEDLFVIQCLQIDLGKDCFCESNEKKKIMAMRTRPGLFLNSFHAKLMSEMINGPRKRLSIVCLGHHTT